MKLQVCIFNLLSIATIVLLGSTGAAKEQYLCQSPNESSIIALEYINSVDEQYCLLGLSGNILVPCKQKLLYSETCV